MKEKYINLVRTRNDTIRKKRNKRKIGNVTKKYQRLNGYKVFSLKLLQHKNIKN